MQLTAPVGVCYLQSTYAIHAAGSTHIVSVFHPAQGDIVFLVSERRSERSGRLYEIGTRARVVGARSELLTLEIDGAPPRDSLVCGRADVSHVASPRPRQATPWYRRRSGCSSAY